MNSWKKVFKRLSIHFCVPSSLQLRRFWRVWRTAGFRPTVLPRTRCWMRRSSCRSFTLSTAEECCSTWSKKLYGTWVRVLKKPWRKSFLFIYLTFTNSNIIYYGLHIKKKQTSYLNIFFFILFSKNIYFIFCVFLTIFLFCCVSLAPFIYFLFYIYTNFSFLL